MDANFQRVPCINSFTLLMNDTNFTTISFLESYSRSCPFIRGFEDNLSNPQNPWFKLHYAVAPRQMMAHLIIWLSAYESA